jgi:hypothetical protein
VLPHRFRPFGVRMAVYVFGALLIGTTLVIWFAFPESVRDQFTYFQRGTVVFFGLAAATAGHALARSRVDARSDGVTVVNGFRGRRYEWNEILAISLRPGSPWAVLDLADGTSIPAMGIQGSDGPRAQRQVRQVRALLEQQSHTDRND